MKTKSEIAQRKHQAVDAEFSMTEIPKADLNASAHAEKVTIEAPAAATADASVQPETDRETKSKASAEIMPYQRPDDNTGKGEGFAPEIVQVSVTALQHHPLNAEYYGPPKIDERLLHSIRDVGIQQPLVVTAEKMVLSGNRRFAAVKQLGWKTVPAIFVDKPDPIDQLETLLFGNAHREKTNLEKTREFEGYVKIENARAKGRQATNVGKGKRKTADQPKEEAEQVPKTSESQLGANLSQAGYGKARDLAAEKVGMSGTSAAQAAKVVQVIDKAKKDGNVALAEELTQDLNVSVNAAVKKTKQRGLVPDPKKTADNGFLASGVSYARFDFNPFNGAGFNDEALAALKKKQPKDESDSASILRVVPDVLSEEFTADTILALGEEIDASPHWTCILETREFKRATKFEWPENAWPGFVVSTQGEVDEAEKMIEKVNAEVKWLHCRLDAESLVFRNLGAFDWIVISLANAAIHWDGVEPILIQARKAKCRVYFDPSVKCRPQEFPQIDRAA